MSASELQIRVVVDYKKKVNGQLVKDFKKQNAKCETLNVKGEMVFCAYFLRLKTRFTFLDFLL